MRSMMYIDAVREVLEQEMARNDRIFVIGEDVDVDGGVWNETEGLLERFGKMRIVGTPISEAGFTGLAAGAAICGLHPVVEFMYPDFIHVAMDQVVNQVAKAELMFGKQTEMGVTLRLCAGGTGTREAAQHSQNLEAWFNHMPGMSVVMPATAEDAAGLMLTALRTPHPVVFIESRRDYYLKQDVPDVFEPIPFGCGRVIRPGKDVTLLTLGYMRTKALEAADMLAGELDVELIDLRSVKPLDMPLILKSVAKTGHVVIAHEAPLCGGIGAEIVRRIVSEGFDLLDAPPLVLGGRDVATPFAGVLEDAVVPQTADIVELLRDSFRK